MESGVIEQIEGIVERYGDTGAHIVVPEALIGYKVKIAIEPEQTLTFRKPFKLHYSVTWLGYHGFLSRIFGPSDYSFLLRL